MVEITNAKIIFRPGKRSLANPKAEKLEEKTFPTIFSATISSVFLKYRKKGNVVRDCPKFVNTGSLGSQCIGIAKISPEFMKELRRSQKKGNTNIIERTISIKWINSLPSIFF